MVMYAGENGQIVGFALWEHKTQNVFFMGQHFDRAVLFILVWKCPVGTAGMYVSVGAVWNQEGGWVEKGQNLKNVPPQNPAGLTFWFSLSLCGSGQMIPGAGQ